MTVGEDENATGVLIVFSLHDPDKVILMKGASMNYDDIKLGHLRRRPSSQRIYKSSAIGDLLFGDGGASLVSADGVL